MGNGYLDSADVLLNRGLNGGYGAAAGLGLVANGNFAGDGSAVKEGVRGNRDISIVDSINGGVRDQFLANQMDRGHQAISDNINIGNQFTADRITGMGIDSKFANITAQLASAERLAYANQAATDRTLKAIELKQVECCCETKAGLAAIDAKVENLATISAKDLEITKLQLQLASASNGPGNSGN